MLIAEMTPLNGEFVRGQECQIIRTPPATYVSSENSDLSKLVFVSVKGESYYAIKLETPYYHQEQILPIPPELQAELRDWTDLGQNQLTQFLNEVEGEDTDL